MTKRRSDRNPPDLVMTKPSSLEEQNKDELQKRNDALMGEEILPDNFALIEEQPAEEAESPVQVQTPFGRVYEEISVALIDQNRFHPRSLYPDAVVAARAEALRAQGQHDPIHVIPHPDAPGRFIICDGWTRVLACVRHNVKDALLAEVHHNLTEQEGALLGYHQNEERSQHYHYDRAMFFSSLLAGGMSSSEIAAMTNTDPADISRYSAFTSLPKNLLDKVLEHPDRFTVHAVYPLYLVDKIERVGNDLALKLAARFVQEERSISWLKDQKQLIVERYTTKRKPRKASGTKINYANGVLKQNGPDFRLALTVEESKADDFRKRLEDLIADFVTTSGAPHELSETEES